MICIFHISLKERPSNKDINLDLYINDELKEIIVLKDSIVSAPVIKFINDIQIKYEIKKGAKIINNENATRREKLYKHLGKIFKDDIY